MSLGMSTGAEFEVEVVAMRRGMSVGGEARGSHGRSDDCLSHGGRREGRITKLYQQKESAATYLQ